MSHRIALRALSVAFGSVVLAGCIADAPSPADTDVQALGTSKAECSEAPPDGRMLYGTFCSLSGPKGLDEDLTTIPEGSPSSPCSA